jgi:hypothetical protein
MNSEMAARMVSGCVASSLRPTVNRRPGRTPVLMSSPNKNLPLLSYGDGVACSSRGLRFKLRRRVWCSQEVRRRPARVAYNVAEPRAAPRHVWAPRASWAARLRGRPSMRSRWCLPVRLFLVSSPCSSLSAGCDRTAKSPAYCSEEVYVFGFPNHTYAFLPPKVYTLSIFRHLIQNNFFTNIFLL